MDKKSKLIMMAILAPLIFTWIINIFLIMGWYSRRQENITPPPPHSLVYQRSNPCGLKAVECASEAEYIINFSSDDS